MGLLRFFRERRPLRTGVSRWLERHQHPANFWIHMLGIPTVLAGVVTLFVLPWDQWYWGVGLILAGYLLQWLGHLVEGNDLGEWAGIKRLLGWRYVAIAPQYQKRDPSDPQHQ